MNLSVDNHASTALLGLDNELCPFHLSLSCWALVAFYAIDLLAGLKHFGSPGTSLFHTALLEAVGLFAVLSLLRYRLSQTALLKAENHPPLKPLKRMSSAVLGAVGLTLASILFSFVR